MAIKIYTKTGDKGMTSLLGGKKLPKNDERIEAYGSIDELNAYIGLIKDLITDQPLVAETLCQVQNHLFNIGAILAVDPADASKFKIAALALSVVENLEQQIDAMENKLEPMKNFVLPGGHPTVAHIHIARCICRRAERNCVRLSTHSLVPHPILPYLNRLSDYLFVLSRFMAKGLGAKEIIWKG